MCSIVILFPPVAPDNKEREGYLQHRVTSHDYRAHPYVSLRSCQRHSTVIMGLSRVLEIVFARTVVFLGRPALSLFIHRERSE